MFLVAIGMLLLPILYLGVVAIAGFAVYYHATENVHLIEYGEFGARFWLIRIALGYSGPLFAGGILVLFMVKPLFVRAPKAPPPFLLKAGDQPLLFQFVYRICALVGAPRPREIRLDNQVNASAAFRRGWISMLGSDLVLTIGLPLTAGLRSDQLAGILAHEFGHFAQTMAMRFSYVIASVNFWFYRVVYERDRLDEWLDKSRASAEYWMWSLVLWLSDKAVNFGRMVLKGLMTVGHWMSAFLSRQMELDADRYECRLVGSITFDRTVLDLNLLSQAAAIGFDNLAESWKNGQLVDNFPSLVALKSHRISPELEKNIRSQIDQEKPNRWSMHPIDKERIAAAKSEKSGGILHLEAPASRLFSNFEKLSREVTSWDYDNRLGEAVKSAELVPFSEYQESIDQSQEALDSASNFAAGILYCDTPPPITAISIPSGHEKQALEEAKASFLSQSEEFKKDFDRLLSAEEDEESLWRHHVLREVGFTTDLGDTRFLQAGDDSLKASLEVARKETRLLRARVAAGNAALGRRVSVALAALRTASFDTCEGIDRLRADADQLSATLSAYADATSLYARFYRAYSGMDVLMQNVEENRLKSYQPDISLTGSATPFRKAMDVGVDENALRRLTRFVVEVCSLAQDLRDVFGERGYPFAAKGRTMLLRDAIVVDVPTVRDLAESCATAKEVLTRYHNTFWRVTAGLMGIAIRVEEEMGIIQGQGDPLNRSS